MDPTQQLRQLIARDQLDEALQQLRTLLGKSPLLDEAIQQSARLHDIRRQIRLGTVSHVEAILTKNQIRAGLLDFISAMEETTARPDAAALREEVERAFSIVNSKNVVVGSTITAGGHVEIGDRTIHTESQISRWLRLFLFLFVPLLAIGGVYFWYRAEELQRPLNLKVRIENKTTNAELPEPEGTLSLTYGAKTEPKAAVSNEALFEGIPANFKTEILRLRFDAKGFVKVDTLFANRESVVIPVFRNDDYAQIKGIVTDNTGRLLEGVKVAIDCCDTITDNSGSFVLNIPFQHQRTKQRLDLSKTGFAARSVTTPVMPGETVRLVLEKQ